MKNVIKVIVAFMCFSFSVESFSDVIKYKNGEVIDLNLSYKNPNYIEVDGDDIVSVNYTDEQIKTESTTGGGALILLTSLDKFTFFIQTKKGLVIPINANPVDSNGGFYKLLPNIAKTNEKVKKWEKISNYENYFLNIAKLIIARDSSLVPELPKGKLPNYSIKNLVIKPLIMFTGNKTKIIKYSIENKSKYVVNINEKDFVQSGVRAVFFESNVLNMGAGRINNVYVFINNGN